MIASNQAKILQQSRRALLSALRGKSTLASAATGTASQAQEWSGHLSFASPDSDFSGLATSHYSSTASANAEQDLKVKFSSAHNEHAQQQSWSNTMSFASPESDFTTSFPMKAEHEPVALPRTMKEVLDHKNDNKAIVVTTAAHPHKIVHVNTAWEELCGYHKDEVLHKPIGSLLQGPKSNTAVARSMTRNLLASMKRTSSLSSPASSWNQESFEAYLVNYKASGEPFVNHVTAGLLFMDENDKDNNDVNNNFLVGILEEVSPKQVPLRMAV
mmetsp:Transcript_22461/g.48899  ORF Transcript_22461/g.48899 Transcript_22461/m.48899 type:complete len:272 (-) Transcript_22461:86-901(-)